MNEVEGKFRLEKIGRCGKCERKIQTTTAETDRGRIHTAPRLCPSCILIVNDRKVCENE